MAFFSLSAKRISRSTGASLVASAAYRMTEKLCDNRTGIVHDYSRKTKSLANIFVCPTMTQEAKKRLWDDKNIFNEIESFEKRKDAQLAKEIMVALPAEISLEENIKLVTEFAERNFKSINHACVISIHPPKKTDKNIHAHLLIPMRSYDENGKLNKIKNRDLDRKETLHSWRQSWELCLNESLEKNGVHQKHSCKSFVALGLPFIEPTKHQGNHWFSEEIKMQNKVIRKERLERLSVLRELGKAYRERGELVEAAKAEVKLSNAKTLNRKDDGYGY